MFSRLPVPATEDDKTGYSRITAPDDVEVYLIESTGHASSTRTLPGVNLSGTIPQNQSVALGGLPPTDADFLDFRKQTRTPNEH